MRQLRAVIVEDSRLARNELKELMNTYDEIQLVGEAENVDDAFTLINAVQPDVLFLDIHMPEKNGFELLEMLDYVPLTVFTTAFDEYAIKSFEFNAFDYLLKPISEKRFSKTIAKIIAQLQNASASDAQDTTAQQLHIDKQIFIKEGEACWLVKIKEITLFEIVGNYTRVHFRNQKPLIYKSLSQIENKLPDALFFRANRQQIINMQQVAKIVTWFNGKLKIEMHSGKEIEISRRQSTIFKDRMSL